MAASSWSPRITIIRTGSFIIVFASPSGMVIVFFNFPIMLVLIVIAESLIKILLTDKWLPSVPLLQLLCITGATYPIHSLNLSMLNVKGRSDLFLKLEIIKVFLIVGTAIICIPYGVLTLVAGQVVISIVAYFINSYYSGKILKYGVKEQIKDIIPYLGLSVIMMILTWSLKLLITDQVNILMISQIIFALLFYIITAKFFNLDAYKKFVIIIKDNILKMN